MLELVPGATCGHIGLYRDEVTKKPIEYYCKLPSDIGNRHVYLIDPMLATGGSANGAVEILKDMALNKSHSFVSLLLQKVLKHSVKLTQISHYSSVHLIENLMKTLISAQA